MATYPSILAWEIPWTEELVSCGPWDRTQSDMTEQQSTHTFQYLLG